MRGLTVFSLLFRTVVLYAAVVAAMRCMGKRQLGELQPGELVTTLLVSNVATLCIDEPDLPLLAGLVPIFLLAALEILHAAASWRWPRYTRVLFGKPVTVILRGEVQQDSLQRLRISGRDLAEALRGQKIDTPARVLWAVMEPGGRLNAVPYAQGGEPPPYLPLLLDGVVYGDCLRAFGRDEVWLAALLQAQGTAKSRVLMLYYNGQDTLLVPKKEAER